MAQIHETVRCLNQLEPDYKDQWIIEQMMEVMKRIFTIWYNNNHNSFQESNIRISKSASNKLQVLKTLELVQVAIARLELQRNSLLQSCIKSKIRYFKQTTFADERDK
jgi:hypothetical protein